MCLGIPMKITAIDQYMAQCEAKGTFRDVSLFLLQDNMPKVGDFVVVNVGYAIETMTAADAQSSWELFDLILESEDNTVAKDKINPLSGEM